MKNLVVKAQAEKKGDRLIAIASTAVEDRHGEVVEVEGWDTKNFKNNPIMLWAHDHSEIAIGKAKNIKVDKSGGSSSLVFEPVFHDKTEKARAIKALYEGWTDEDGVYYEPVLNSFSVGFRPLDTDGNRYTKQELLEISAVNVPANPEARVIARKSLESMGFEDKTIKEVLDENEKQQDHENVIKQLGEELAEKQAEIDELKNEVASLRASQSSKNYLVEQRLRRLKALDRLTEDLIKDSKKEITHGKN